MVDEHLVVVLSAVSLWGLPSSQELLSRLKRVNDFSLHNALPKAVAVTPGQAWALFATMRTSCITCTFSLLWNEMP